MNNKNDLGGIIHTYLGYDPVNFPSPNAPPPDLASPAMEHLLFYGNTRRLTEEELANAVHIDPSQIRGLGPSLEAIAEMLRERKRKILATYETSAAQEAASKQFHEAADKVQPPKKLADRFRQAVKEEQLPIWRTSSTLSVTIATRSPARIVWLLRQARREVSGR